MGQPAGAWAHERVQGRLAVLSGLLLTWALAWAPPAGLIVEDTKNDLYVDPARFLIRTLHLWDPQMTWGVMQNQAYGYLFPMGPFFAVGNQVLPVWVVQRLWWTLLLSGGFLGMLWLLRELGVRSVGIASLGALSYVFSARVVTTISGLSTEALPTLLAPLILAPLVRGSNGLIGPRRAAALSGCALLACGGVNATATAWAAVPAALWLITRAKWWRAPLTWWWGASVMLASVWWLGPLLILGRFSPPFLEWIEDAKTVAAPVGLLDVIRGTTHWLGHLSLPAGPWWPAGYDIVTDPVLVLATSAIAGLGLAGLSQRGMRHRRFLLLTAILGLVVLSVPHSGAIGSPAAESAQRLLDGALAPLRNFHKADLLVRLPVSIALAFGLERLSNSHVPGRFARLPRMGLWLVALAVLTVASPGFVGRSAPPGAFPAIAPHWREVASWLDAHEAPGRSLIVPASTFGEYTWGRTIDEPLRPLADAPFAVRDGVPLTPANTVRFLDAVERRLQSGRAANGLPDGLARVGVRYILLRNDLDTKWTGGVSPVYARSSLLSTPGLDRVASFGQPAPNELGDLVAPVEVYEVKKEISAHLQLYDAEALVGVSGSSEALLQLADAGVDAPIIFDGDQTGDVSVVRRAETDAYQARGRSFGATRGRDFTDLVAGSQDVGLRDYRPWKAPSLRATRSYLGIGELTASSSVARDQALVELRPENGVAAAVDGDESTAWLTYGDAQPWIRIQLAGPTQVDRVVIGLPSEEMLSRDGVAAPTKIRVTTDAGAIDHDMGLGLRETVVRPPAGATSHVTISVLETDDGPPGISLTGIAEIVVPRVDVSATMLLPEPVTSEPSEVILLRSWEGMQDGCVLSSTRDLRCLADGVRRSDEVTGLNRVVTVTRAGEFHVEGTFALDGIAEPASVGRAGSTLRVSSLRPSGTNARALIDADSRTAWSPSGGDRSPSIVVEFDVTRPVEHIRLATRDRWAARFRPFVEVEVDGTVHITRLSRDGSLQIPRTEASRVEITLLPDTQSANLFLSLEVERLIMPGLPETPYSKVLAECGTGPSLTVDGRAVPTRVWGEADARLGLEPVRFEACAAVSLTSQSPHVVMLERWGDFRAETMVFTESGRVPIAAVPSEVAFTRDSPARIHAEISEGERPRLLVLDENKNDAWAARLDGQPLTPQVVDGFRQAFVIPPAQSGQVVVEFEADRLYRLVLLLGGALALVLCVLAVWPGDRGRRVIPAASGMVPRGVGWAFLLVLTGLLSGALGVAIAALLALLSAWAPVRQHFTRLLPGVVFALILVAGAVQAGAEVTAGEPQWVDLVTPALCLAAISLVVLGAPPRTSSASRRGSSSSRPTRP